MAPNERELSNLFILLISSKGAISPMSSPTSSSENKSPVSLEYVKKLKIDFFPDLKKSPHEKKFASMLFQVPTHHKTLETWSDEGTLMPDFIGLTGTVCVNMNFVSWDFHVQYKSFPKSLLFPLYFNGGRGQVGELLFCIFSQ